LTYFVPVKIVNIYKILLYALEVLKWGSNTFIYK
jgi:hypothetical protein